MNDDLQRYNQMTQLKIQIAAESVVYKKNDDSSWNKHNGRCDKIPQEGRLWKNSRPWYNPQQQQEQQQQQKMSKKFASTPSTKAASKNAIAKSSSNNKKKNNNTIMFSTRDERFFVKTAKNIDILIGRGKPYQIHPGNRIMRRLVAENKDLYNNSRRDLRKAVALNLLEGLTKCGVRFLKRCMEPPRNALFLNDNDGKKGEKEPENCNDNNIIRGKECNMEKHDEKSVKSTISYRVSSNGNGIWIRDGGCWELASKDEACEKLCHALRFKPSPSSSNTNTSSQSLLARQQQQQQQQQSQQMAQLDDPIEMSGINDVNSNNNSTSSNAADSNTPKPVVDVHITKRNCSNQLDANAMLYDNTIRPSLPRIEMISILQDLLDHQQKSALSRSTLHPTPLSQELGLMPLLRDRMLNLSNSPDGGFHGNQHYHSVTNSPASIGNRDMALPEIGGVIEQLLSLSQERDPYNTALNELAAHWLSLRGRIWPNYQIQQGELLEILQNAVRSTIVDHLVSLLGGTPKIELE